MEGIEARLRRLERANRRLTAALLTLGVGFAVVVTAGAGAAPARVIDAQGFRVLDASGRVRGSFVIKEGAAFLSVLDADGKVRVMLGTTPKEDAMLGLGGPDGKSNGMLVAPKEGVPYLSLSDREDREVFRKP